MTGPCLWCGAMPRDVRHRESCPGREIPQVRYDREVLVNVLVYHWRKDISGCGCGWTELGASFPEYVADVYEASVAGVVPHV